MNRKLLLEFSFVYTTTNFISIGLDEKRKVEQNKMDIFTGFPI